MGWFFTKAALLTFGGAYAVLPYVYQGAVEGHGWLTAAQMIDGLALGETTPGPLIMVVAFVGFVGGWGAEAVRPGPDFFRRRCRSHGGDLFHFPALFHLHSRRRPADRDDARQPRVTAPLTAITAAVVGVILNLAVFFAYHVLWPAGFNAGFEWPLLAIGVAAGVALFRFRAAVIPVLLACGAAGLVYQVLARSLLG